MLLVNLAGNCFGSSTLYRDEREQCPDNGREGTGLDTWGEDQCILVIVDVQK